MLKEDLMNILRRVAQLAIDINKIHPEAALKAYGRIGVYRRFYTDAGTTRFRGMGMAQPRSRLDAQRSEWFYGRVCYVPHTRRCCLPPVMARGKAALYGLYRPVNLGGRRALVI